MNADVPSGKALLYPLNEIFAFTQSIKSMSHKINPNDNQTMSRLLVQHLAY